MRASCIWAATCSTSGSSATTSRTSWATGASSCSICCAGSWRSSGMPSRLPDSTVPMIGASGAISGVLGAYLLLFPRARVLVLIPAGFLTRVVPVPAVVVLGFWIVMQIIYGAFSWGGLGGGVAWFAHADGFAAGLALIKVFQRRPVNDIFRW